MKVITIVGRPNVGKSTLFNYLTSGREAIVSDMPGVTRDRQYGTSHRFGRDFIVVDTGGVAILDDDDPTENKIMSMTEQHVEQAISEADYLLFVVDGKVGLTADDEILVKRLRRQHKKFIVVVNKADRLAAAEVAGDFYKFGAEELFVIAAKSGRGIANMIDHLFAETEKDEEINPPPADCAIDNDIVDGQISTGVVADSEQEQQQPLDAKNPGIVITVLGQPNVGKSTLINTMLGEQRVMVYDAPGTTRDSIAIPFSRRGQDYTLIDTAGVRRRSKITADVEKFSVIKSMQAIERADVVVYLLDATRGITDQDMRLLRQVMKSGSSLVVMFNKWDLLDEAERLAFKSEVDRRLMFVDFVRRYHLSALHGTGLGELYRAVHEAYAALGQDFTTSNLTKLLEQAVESHQPPLMNGRRAKLRYAHVARKHPLCFMVHGKQVEKLAGSYKRYLVNYFRKRLSLVGVPIHLEFKNDDNPYDSKKS